MFGIKFRSWMESHIVRPRKKQQQRGKEGKGKANGKVVPERALLDSVGNSPTSPVVPKKSGTHNNQHVLRCDLNYSGQQDEAGPCSKTMETMALPSHQHGYTGTNLSSPESAYSTGYSTDGTSPGTSFPPEYYINIRTGTHYFHSAATTPTAPANPGPGGGDMLPRAANVECETRSKMVKMAPESDPHPHRATPEVLSSEECQAPPLQPHSHRRTESCDESRRYPAAIRTSFAQLDDAPVAVVNPAPTAAVTVSVPGPSLLGTVLQATPSHAVTASPRQRNRIRTNPWVASGKTTVQGESSSSYGSGSDVTLPRTQATQPQAEECTDEIVNSPPHRPWCRPQPSAGSTPGVTSQHRRDSLCSSSSSSSSQTPNNPSDLSEDDDLTLNEMLGKFDESYVYEKETDILSDSDPTDCDEDYGDTDFDTGQDGGDEQDPHDDDDDDELDFIDNGSYLDLDDSTDKSTSSANGIINKGHCTYHMHNVGADFVRKPTMRFRESFLRRSSGRRHINKDDSSGSPGHSSRHSSCRKIGEEGHSFPSRRSSRESSKHRRHTDVLWSAGGGSSVSATSSRTSSEKKRMRCSMRRNCSIRDRLSAPNKIIAQENVSNGNLVNGVDRIKMPDIESTGVLNLNRVLMQKMLARGNVSGTRSAGNTPVSLRRRLINNNDPESMKKNVSISKLVTSESNHNKAQCNSDQNSNIDISTSSNIMDNAHKKRSYSISYGIRGDDLRKTITNTNHLATFASELALIEADKEAERKYKELILEAEHILVSMKGNIPGKCLNFMVPKPKPFFLNSKYIVDDCHKSKAINQVKSVVVDTTELPIDNNNSDNSLKSGLLKQRLNSPKRVLDGLSVHKQIQHFEKGDMRQLPVTNGLKQHDKFGKEKSLDIYNALGKQEGPVVNGPLSRSSSSESDGSTTPQQTDTATTPTAPAPQQQRPPLVTFRSIDLGHALGGSGYCPQSEPVKRKVYTCSATFDRLQKSLEKSQHQTSLRLKADADEKSGKSNLKEKLEQLRRERLEVEAKVREAQEDERKRLDDKAQCQRQLSLFRRQMLVHTIEGLKRSLEDQSAKLQETFQPDGQEIATDSVGSEEEPLGENVDWNPQEK